jgi:hypothetical protein
MLGPALMLMLVATMLSSALLASGLLAARIAALQTAGAYANAAADGAVQALREALAVQIADDVARARRNRQWPPAHAYDPPAPSGGRPLCSAPCSYIATADWQRSTGGETVTASGLQGEFVDEDRVAEAVTVTLTSPRGDVLAVRKRLVTLRVLDVPPYAIVSGQLDAASPSGAAGGAQGDVAADASARIGAIMQCQLAAPVAGVASPANDGLPWGVAAGNAGAHEVSCSRAYSSVDRFVDRSWRTGYAGTDGWTP